MTVSSITVDSVKPAKKHIALVPEPISDSPTKFKKTITEAQLKNRHKRYKVYGSIFVTTTLIVGILYCAYQYNQWSQRNHWYVQSPIVWMGVNSYMRNWIVLEPVSSHTSIRTIMKEAKAQYQEPTLEDKITQIFGKDAPTFIKIAHAESTSQGGAKGWNCYYTNAKGERYSAACKEGDRGKAWSVDCGIMQVNVTGQKCPSELYDTDVNLQAAKGKFERQGFKAWSVCKYRKIDCGI